MTPRPSALSHTRSGHALPSQACRGPGPQDWSPGVGGQPRLTLGVKRKTAAARLPSQPGPRMRKMVRDDRAA